VKKRRGKQRNPLLIDAQRFNDGGTPMPVATSGEFIREIMCRAGIRKKSNAGFHDEGVAQEKNEKYGTSCPRLDRGLQLASTRLQIDEICHCLDGTIIDCICLVFAIQAFLEEEMAYGVVPVSSQYLRNDFAHISTAFSPIIFVI
jgi:hypothetical protein